MSPILKPGAFYTTAELATFLKLRPRTIQRWIEAGELKAYRFGRKYHIRGEDFDAFLETYKAHDPGPPAPPLPVDTGHEGYCTVDASHAPGAAGMPAPPQHFNTPKPRKKHED